jgi:hypothetical protein
MKEVPTTEIRRVLRCTSSSDREAALAIASYFYLQIQVSFAHVSVWIMVAPTLQFIYHTREMICASPDDRVCFLTFSNERLMNSNPAITCDTEQV